MLMIGAVLFAYVGMLLLCLGMQRHYKQVWNRVPSWWLQRGLRGLGWAALMVSFALCVMAWNWAMGPAAWGGVISLAGFGLVMMLPYGPRLAVALAGAVPVWGVAFYFV
jgi:hypothetical protein